MSLQEQLLKTLYEAGAAQVGVADMAGVPGCDFPFGVSVVLPLEKHIVKDILTAPTEEYLAAYYDLNRRLNELVLTGEEFLRAKGYRALAQLRDDSVQVDGAVRVPLPYKTAATRAGLGWIGKNALLVTPEYGCAIRIATLLTDAPLTPADPVEECRCGSCTLCVDACPAGALHGAEWKPGIPREELVDTVRCESKMREIMMENLGVDFDLCGKCFAVCPYPPRWLRAPIV